MGVGARISCMPLLKFPNVPLREPPKNFQDFEPGFIIGHGYRMHRFRSTGSAITGLTADIMVRYG